ncbi:MAG TPA: murein biosynthesis integral membrane protein MurJ [Actinomycetota bacterium]|nr:murein biosynthesis integral membrane protein MurJ [Actinomycetota bacterium]
MRNTALMTVGTTLSRLTGYVRIAAQTAALGVTVGALGNVYVQANTTPNIVYELILGGVLTSVFVPVFVDHRRAQGSEAAFELGSRVLTLALVILAALAVVGIALAPQIMRLYLVASDTADREAQIELGVFLLRWFMPQVVFYGIGAIAGGLLNAEGRFGPPMFAPILNNVVAIAAFGTYALLHAGSAPSVEDITWLEKTVLGAGTTLGVVAMTLALWPSLYATGFRWKLRGGWRHPGIRRVVKLSGWVVLYVTANQLAYLAIIVLAGSIDGQARFQIYATAFVVFLLPHSIFAVSIFTALLPGMAERWGAGDLGGVRERFSLGLRDTVVVIVPAALGFIVLAGPITSLLLEHGAAGAADARLIARTLQGFAVGLPFFSTFQLITRTFYASQDSRTPALINVGAAAVTVGVDMVLVVIAGWDVPGLALGHAASYLVATGAGIMLLRVKLGSIDGARVTRTIERTLAASVATALAAWLVATGIAAVVDTQATMGRLVQVSLAVVAGACTYLGAALMFGLQEVDEVVGAVRRRFRG